MSSEIKVVKADSNKHSYWAFVDGVMLRNKIGVGRRFKTEAAAQKAGEKAVELGKHVDP